MTGLPLAALGWDDDWERTFAPHRHAGSRPARVSGAYTHVYRVLGEGIDHPARVSGRFRHEARGPQDFPTAGDWVAVRPDPSGAHMVIQALLPRRSRFSRRLAGAVTGEQVVAANVDIVFLMMGLDGDYNLRRLDRYLVLAWESGARPVVLLNKADLVVDAPVRVAEVERHAPGVPVHAISAARGSGLEALAPYLAPARTIALLGSSGVGKSSLINRLAGQEVMRIGDVRSDDRRGRHTTRHRQLVVLPGGALFIDTPGMRELQLWEAGEGFTEAFEDIEALARGCRFADCGHRTEPDCAVQQAVQEGRLPPERLDSYLKLKEELRAFAAEQERRARVEARRARGASAARGRQATRRPSKTHADESEGDEWDEDVGPAPSDDVE